MMEDKINPVFNQELARLERLNIIRRECHNRRFENEHFNWFQCLRSWHSELYENMSKAERSEAMKREKIFLRAFRENETKNIHEGLFEYELWLIDIENKQEQANQNNVREM